MSITAIQQALKAAGFNPGPIDGVRGPKTTAAIKAFQRSKGLVADGIVGPKTTSALGGGGGGSSRGKKASGPTIDEKLMAQDYGWAMAVLNSDPELKALFKKAVAGTWDANKFNLLLRDTKWYQRHNEQWRNTQILKATDPASYATKLAQTKQRIAMMSAELGAAVGKKIDSIAEQALSLGWDDNQIRANLSIYVQYTDGRMFGQAGQWDQELRAWAQDNGLTLSDKYYQQQISSATAGKQTIEDAKRSITSMAISAYPHLSDRLRAGDTIATIADPYRQTMAALLELNPDAINLSDPSIKNALSARDKDGKPVLKTLYDFENDTRKDKRWLGTKNAQDSAMTTTKRVLGDMGLV